MHFNNVLIDVLAAGGTVLLWSLFWLVRDKQCLKHTGQKPTRPAILMRLMWFAASVAAIVRSDQSITLHNLPLFAIIVFTGYLASRLDFWISESRHMQISGHLAPPPSIWARAFWWVVTPIIARLSVGPVTVIGQDKLKKLKGRVVFSPNHHYQMDFNMVSKAVRRHFRYMTAASELKGANAIFGAWTGSIPVNTKVEGGGEAALNASIECMVDDPNGAFLIFPQGKLLPLDEIKREDFRTGAARLITALDEETESEPAWIVPMGLYYKSDRSSATILGRMMAPVRKMVFGKVKFGCVVVVGDPIAARDFPNDAKAGTDLIYERICACVREAALHASGATK